MSRISKRRYKKKYKEKFNSNTNNNTNGNTTDDIKPEMIEVAKQVLQDYADNFDKYADQYSKSLYNMAQCANSMYQPNLGQSYTQDINMSKFFPSQATLKEWLKYPESYQKQLRGVSQYFSNVIMQYNRTTDYFSRMLLWRYDLRSVNSPDMSVKFVDNEDIEIDKKIDNNPTWNFGYKRCKEFLRKFNLPYQGTIVVDKAMQEGGYFGYLRDGKDFATLIEIPSDYCYITGKWDLGWTYAIDLTWFDNIKFNECAVPELYEYYKLFVKMRDSKDIDNKQLAFHQYYPVPMEKGFVFSFDLIRAQVVPPLRGLFKDALGITEYKDLLKQKTQLDTWKIIAQIIPKDKDTNKPSIGASDAGKFVANVQSVLPSGAFNFATPMDVKELSFNNSQNQNNIIGLGESLYWRSIGINPAIMDSGDKTQSALKVSTQNDYGYISHLYLQFENFINFQLYLRSRTNVFRIKLYGNRYTEDEDIQNYSELVAKNNLPVGKLLALSGIEPYEIDGVLDMENYLGWKDKLKPVLSAFNTKGIGAPTKKDSDLKDSGGEQKDYDSNNTSGKT